MDVTKFIDEARQFHLLIFQREFEHDNEGIWTRSIIEIVALDVIYQRKLTLHNVEF